MQIKRDRMYLKKSFAPHIFIGNVNFNVLEDYVTIRH